MMQLSHSWSALTWIAWLSVGIVFMADAQSSLVPIAAAIALSLSAALILRSPISALYLLPLPLMIGPMLSLSIPGAGNVTVGDVYSALLILRVIGPNLSQFRLRQRPALFFGAVLLTLSALFSSDLAASFVALARIVQFALLIWISISLIDRRQRWLNLLTSWTLITTLCATLMLSYLARGEPGFMLSWAIGGDNPTAEVDRIDIFLRPAFFYTNFFIPLGLSLIYAVVVALNRVRTDRGVRILLYASIPINLAVLVLNNTRAMLIPVIGIVALTILWTIGRSLVRGTVGWIVLASLISAVTVGASVLADHILPGAQLLALQQRSGDLSPVDMRLDTWKSAISQTTEQPLRLMTVGWGPQATTRQGGPEIAALLTSAEGTTEGAFDSTIVGLLVEYGIAFTVLILGYVAIWAIRVWQAWRTTNDSLPLMLFLMGLALVFAHFFQQFGISPPALMALQVLAFIPHRRNGVPRGRP